MERLLSLRLLSHAVCMILTSQLSYSQSFRPCVAMCIAFHIIVEKMPIRHLHYAI